MFIPGALPKLERTLPIQLQTVKEEFLEIWRKNMEAGTASDVATGFPYKLGGAIPQVAQASLPARSGSILLPVPEHEARMLREPAGKDACATSQPFLNLLLILVVKET